MKLITHGVKAEASALRCSVVVEKCRKSVLRELDIGGGEDAAVTETAEEEDELELDETWGGAPGEDGPAGEAAPESDLELDETWGGEDAAAEPAEEDDDLDLTEEWGV